MSAEIVPTTTAAIAIHAERITASWQKTVASIIETADLLAERVLADLEAQTRSGAPREEGAANTSISHDTATPRTSGDQHG